MFPRRFEKFSRHVPWNRILVLFIGRSGCSALSAHDRRLCIYSSRNPHEAQDEHTKYLSLSLVCMFHRSGAHKGLFHLCAAGDLSKTFRSAAPLNDKFKSGFKVPAQCAITKKGKDSKTGVDLRRDASLEDRLQFEAGRTYIARCYYIEEMRASFTMAMTRPAMAKTKVIQRTTMMKLLLPSTRCRSR